MKAVVFAYHNIGCEGINALIENGFEIQCIFTHTDNPSENTWFRSVAELASAKGIELCAPENPNHPLWVERVREMQPDFIFSFYYRHMLGKELLSIPRLGAINLHGSLLPKYRGRVPINWAVIRGEKETGVTLHYMTEKPDAGDILAQERFPIGENDTALDVHLNAAKAAAELLKKALPQLKNGSLKAVKQDESQAEYFHGRTPADGVIDFSRSSAEIRNLVRGVTRPYPGAFAYLGEKKYIFWQVTETAVPTDAAPGTILSVSPLTVACGEGALQVDFAQQEGGLYCSGSQLAKDAKLVEKMVFVFFLFLFSLPLHILSFSESFCLSDM